MIYIDIYQYIRFHKSTKKESFFVVKIYLFETKKFPVSNLIESNYHRFVILPIIR